MPARSTAARKASRRCSALPRSRRPVDGAERLLQSPGLGDQGLVGEQLDEASPVAFGEPFARLEQTVAGVVELGSPARVVAAAAGALRPPPPDGSLSFAANGVQRGVGAADQVEVVDDDPGVRQFGADRLPVGVVGVDRDDLDRAPCVFGQRAQVALDAAPAAPVEHLDHAPAVEIGHDGRELAAASVMGLIER